MMTTQLVRAKATMLGAETDRRTILSFGGGLVAAMATAMPALGQAPIAAAAPIAPAERLARLRRAQGLMRANGMAALLVEAGSSLNYFTGVKWWRSERLTAAILPVDGDLCVVTPGFEEPSIREMLGVPGEVQVWQEDEDPAALVARWLTARKLQQGVIGVEDTVRFFAVDGLRKALPGARLVNGAGIVNGCRMIKTPAEIALMQRASDITIAAYRSMAPKVEKGMGTADVFALMSAAIVRLGGETPSGSAQINEGTALPHGSREPQFVRPGSVVLMDCGCTVDGYHADISRTFVFGEPTKAQRAMWADVHRGQDIAMAAAKVGATAGSVDDAVRADYESRGYGPGYATPGLPHRTGHGIGLDVHEPVNLVHGETTRLAPGMCFSNEPGLYRPGAFGIRLEDCFYMTASGPRYFSVPPPSIDDPFA